MTRLLCVIFSVILSAVAYADNANDLDMTTSVNEAIAIADASSGVSAEVDALGRLYVENKPKAVTGVVKAADAQIKGSAGVVYSVIFSFDGVTSGDTVLIKNSTDNSGTALISFTCGPTDGVMSFTPPVGVTFSTGIYCDVTKSSGTMDITVVYE